MPCNPGKVTGGGQINVVSPAGIGNFGFNVQTKNGVPAGSLEYHNHARDVKVKSVSITSLCVFANTATFSGTCTKNGAPCTFSVTVQDNGEPGSADTFSISVSGEPTDAGTLTGGNIQIH